MTILSKTIACRMNATAYLLAALLVALPFSILGSVVGDKDPQTLPLCDVLRDPTKYNGKIIAVRGYLSGGSEGSVLMDDCETHLTTTQGLVWPNSISLGSPANALVPISFTPDYETLKQTPLSLAKQIKGGKYDQKHDRIWETYVGQFETWENVNSAVYTDLNGGQHLAGFGHLGAAPAQLIVKTVKDAVVEHLEKPKQNLEKN